MKRIRNIEVPTGNIVIAQGEKGKNLEYLSLGDYGQGNNVKADFLGLREEIEGVKHGELLPLEEKWVITISSQYGCSMGCKFCDVPKVGKGLNATHTDLVEQVKGGIALHPEVEKTKRLNVHYARMGEPTWNPNVLTSARELGADLKSEGWGFHPVVSTMMPKNNKNLEKFLNEWMHIKNETLNGEAGLQLSINTTDDVARQAVMPCAMTVAEISEIAAKLPKPKGRKIALNFALTQLEVDAKRLRELFDPEYFMCKITPMHMTNACENNDLKTVDGYESYYPYREVEESLKEEGFDVLVFIPSYEEDKGRITCGNAILSGSVPECEYKDII